MTPIPRWNPGPRRAPARGGPVPPTRPMVPPRPGPPITSVVPAEHRPCRTVTDLLDTFTAAFAAGDLDAIAGCHTVPTYVVTDRRTVTFGARAEIAEGFSETRRQHLGAGFSSVGYELVSETVLGPDLTEVTVCWSHRGRSGRTALDSYRYLLRRVEGGWLVHLALVLAPTAAEAPRVPEARTSPDRSQART